MQVIVLTGWVMIGLMIIMIMLNFVILIVYSINHKIKQYKKTKEKKKTEGRSKIFNSRNKLDHVAQRMSTHRLVKPPMLMRHTNVHYYD